MAKRDARTVFILTELYTKGGGKPLRRAKPLGTVFELQEEKREERILAAISRGLKKGIDQEVPWAVGNVPRNWGGK